MFCTIINPLPPLSPLPSGKNLAPLTYILFVKTKSKKLFLFKIEKKVKLNVMMMQMLEFYPCNRTFI